jgi:hypothetical protein
VHEIVGVMPDRFGFVDFSRFWIPLGESLLAERGQRTYQAIARLGDDVSIDQATADLARVAGELATTYPATNLGWSVTAFSLESTRSEPFFSALIVAVLFVLLIACANVGNLLLARGAARRGELAVRIMIGAPQKRVLRQLLTESTVLACAGAGLGLLLALWGTDVLVALLPTDQLPLWIDFGIDARVLAYTIAVVFVAVLTFGLAPALTILRGDLSLSAREGARRASASRSSTKMRNGLIVAEIALSMVLLASAGALLRSSLATSQADPGYDPSRILRMSVALSERRYRSEQQRQNYLHLALANLARVRGAESSAATASLPLSRVAGASGALGTITPEGQRANVAAPARPYSAVHLTSSARLAWRCCAGARSALPIAPAPAPSRWSATASHKRFGPMRTRLAGA